MWAIAFSVTAIAIAGILSFRFGRSPAEAQIEEKRAKLQEYVEQDPEFVNAVLNNDDNWRKKELCLFIAPVILILLIGGLIIL